MATIRPSLWQQRLLSLFAQPGTGALASVVGGEAVESRKALPCGDYLQTPWLADHGNEVRLINEPIDSGLGSTGPTSGFDPMSA